MCIAGALVDRLLTQTLRLADLAMPIDPWRGRLWAAAPLPPLCSALTAYRSDAPGMRALIVEAAGRLINGSERHLHPDVNPSDQTALWFAYVLSAPRTSLRILALPEAHLHVETSRPRAPDRPALQHAPPAPEQTQDGLEPRPAPTKPRPSPGQAPANRQMYSGWPRPTLMALIYHITRRRSARARRWAVPTCSRGRRRERGCSPSPTSARAGWGRSRVIGGVSTAATRCTATATRTSRSSVCCSPPR